jgi:hypothetical protein
LQVAAGDRHAQHRQGGLGRQHARQVRRPAGAGDDAPEPAASRGLGILEEQIRCAVRGNHLALTGYAEIAEPAFSVLHHIPVGVTAHHQPDQRCCHDGPFGWGDSGI